MLKFRSFLVEQEEQSRQIKHLTHIEDRPLHSGGKGLEHSLSSLEALDKHIKGKGHSSDLSTKYDGSPSVVYGHHPETGKFFVASKSAFNKTPKINYSPEDIEKNHGHAPGLVEKLKAALEHLPKIAPKKGVYQGDLMYTKGDLKKSKGGVSFQPNPSGLTYTAHGREAEKANKAHLGIVTHLKYTGNDPKNLNASHEVNHHEFTPHPDVHTIDPRADTSKVNYDSKAQQEFQKHIKAAKELHKAAGNDMYKATEPHQGPGGHLETYINQTVRTGAKPSHKGLMSHVENKYLNAAEKLKSEKGKQAKYDELAKHIEHIKNNKEHYNNLLKLHGHIQGAKNVLVNTLNQHQDFEHSHGGEKANPEGYVFHHGGESDKLIHRHEFSRRNLTGRDR